MAYLAMREEFAFYRNHLYTIVNKIAVFFSLLNRLQVRDVNRTIAGGPAFRYFYKSLTWKAFLSRRLSPNASHYVCHSYLELTTEGIEQEFVSVKI